MMDNPFNPGSGSIPPFLAGRGEEIASFRRMLKSIAEGKSANMMVVGLRGTGKTVLLNEMSKICTRENFFPIRRLQFTEKYSNPKDFLGALEYDTYTAVSSLSITKKMIGRIKTTGTKLKPKKIGLPGDFYYEPSYESKSVPFENQVEEYLSKNWIIFEKSGYNGVVFLFDEFQYVADMSDKGFYVLSDFIGAINELQKKGFPYHLVLSGLPKLSLGVKTARPYSERMFQIQTLDNLPKEDAIMAISEPMSKLPVKFEKKLVDEIVHDTGSYPYFIQFYCKEIIDSIPKKRITLRDYELIKPTILKQLENSFFDARIETLSNTEEMLLVAMSKITARDIPFGEIVRASKIKRTSISGYLAGLERKGIIHNHRRGVYRFSLPLLREYIVRKYGQ